MLNPKVGDKVYVRYHGGPYEVVEVQPNQVRVKNGAGLTGFAPKTDLQTEEWPVQPPEPAPALSGHDPMTGRPVHDRVDRPPSLFDEPLPPPPNEPPATAVASADGDDEEI